MLFNTAILNTSSATLDRYRSCFLAFLFGFFFTMASTLVFLDFGEKFSFFCHDLKNQLDFCLHVHMNKPNFGTHFDTCKFLGG